MKKDEYGTIGYTEDEICEHLRSNPNLSFENVFVQDCGKYLLAKKTTYLDMPSINLWGSQEYDVSPKEYHALLQTVWLMPEEYQTFDIETWLQEQCKTEEQLERVCQELILFHKFDLMNLLRYLRYLREVARKNGIVWGVGRGSSCSSYCLFLMGIHKVDAYRYNLDITDFLKEK
jgi:DNA polymerase III alpha subunit